MHCIYQSLKTLSYSHFLLHLRKHFSKLFYSAQDIQGNNVQLHRDRWIIDEPHQKVLSFKLLLL